MRSIKPIWLLVILMFISGIVAVCIWAGEEMRSSRLQARNLSQMAGSMTVAVEDGPQQSAWFPTYGPYNQRLGYTYLPYFIKALRGSNYEVNAQAQPSKEFMRFVHFGGFPIYRAKTTAGLAIYDRNGAALHSMRYPTRTFDNFDAIPPVLTGTLLFIENRELLDPDASPTRNPAIEWDRFMLAGFGHILGLFVPSVNTGGGSTLATQIEKFRFSPEGQTSSAREKIKQIISASMRAYMDGPDTTGTRRQIVLDYLNATPLSARAGWGEINGVGDGLWAWFGRELHDTSAQLNFDEDDRDLLRVKAQAYRHVLALILAQRRPSYYLATNRGELEQLIDITLTQLAQAGVITAKLRDAAAKEKLLFLAAPPPVPGYSFVAQKAVSAVRMHLLNLFGIKSLYELDRFDMRASTTLDMPVQEKVTDFLQKLKDPDFLKEAGLQGFRLLGENSDPTKINWTIVLYEKGEGGNEVRVQADNLDQPLDLNEGAKLDLGSTAKLRTMITYLEILSELHKRFAAFDDDALAEVTEDAPDALTKWTITWLREHKDRNLQAMLDDAIQRSYSANPRETFYTGGGVHRFNNFDHKDDHRIVPLAEAFRHSINLPFIRLMRDIVNYTIAQGPERKQVILGDPDYPARQEYLERFADQEGSVFLNRYFVEYSKLDEEESFERLIKRSRKSMTALTTVYRSVYPEQPASALAEFLRERVPGRRLSDEQVARYYVSYGTDAYNLADRGYIAGVHPLELWLVGWLRENRGVARRDMLKASRDQRLQTYSWLFRTRHKSAQDNRIRILLEQDAFDTIQQRWARLGYPFGRLVPSLATAIGSSADKPGALAELMGIIVNDGVKLPTVRLKSVEFAPGTPYQTAMTRKDRPGEKVLPHEVVATVRTALMDVVANGTARRVSGVFKDAAGNLLPVGGKTGTGDHRFDEFAPGGRLISSRVVKRTATLVFFIDDRLFGSITAYVAGPDAAKYSFTSALPAQMLTAMAPILQPLVDEKQPATISAVETARAASLP
ncbi:MAG: glycosyl transferase family 51 [Alphaproteobacteria bacterium]|nr:glycosyl transferase family 51 [Alphaproteobacteria bacterium]